MGFFMWLTTNVVYKVYTSSIVLAGFFRHLHRTGLALNPVTLNPKALKP